MRGGETTWKWKKKGKNQSCPLKSLSFVKQTQQENKIAIENSPRKLSEPYKKFQEKIRQR